MTEISKFQQMNGCSACAHAAPSDPDGKPASAHGANFWCSEFKKPVQTKEGSSCPSWKYEE